MNKKELLENNKLIAEFIGNEVINVVEKKEKLRKLSNELLDNAINDMRHNIDKVLNSSCIDIETWNENIDYMILPKSILTAILTDASTKYACKGTKFEKIIKKESKNIGYFI